MSETKLSSSEVGVSEVVEFIKVSGLEVSSDYKKYCEVLDKLAPIMGRYCVKNVAWIGGFECLPLSEGGTDIATGWVGLPIPVRTIKRPPDPHYEHLDIPILARDALNPIKELAGHSIIYEDIFDWWRDYYANQSKTQEISLADDGIPNAEFLYFSSLSGGIIDQEER